MDYKKYFEQLIKRNMDKKELFPNKKVFGYDKNKKNYYSNPYIIDGFKFSFVISKKDSEVYGAEGFIVEFLSEDTSQFEQLYANKTKIEEEFNKKNIKIIWQKKSPSSKTRSRIYVQKLANIEDMKRWNEYIDWQINTMIKFLEVLPKYTKELNNNISIIDKLKNVLSDKMGQILKFGEIIDLVLEKYPDTNRASVIPSDYCYNIKNKGSSTKELFLYLDNANYKYVGENYKMEKDNSKIKNIILYGVPGVGKTYNTKKLISLMELNLAEKNIFENIEKNDFFDLEKAEDIKDRVKFITFHQSFGYEDFIEGFRPNEDGNIELQDGVFKDFCEKAKEKEKENFYFVIDEINRANISKVFGELITLIEEDKRKALSVTLPYSKKSFSIPKNIYIIGTMNSTDKSIALIDIALRRRFTFLKMNPNPKLVEKYPRAKEKMENLNEKIIKSLGEDYQIGHSYFMGIEDEEDLSFTCKYKIKPLLEEYFYGDKEGFDRVYEVIKDVCET